MKRTTLAVAAIALALSPILSGCSSNSGGGGGAGPTQASLPDTGGIGADPGTEQDFMLNVGRRTFFKQGSAALDDTARVTVDKQAQWLSKYPQWRGQAAGLRRRSGFGCRSSSSCRSSAPMR